jgi:hypothetical protein
MPQYHARSPSERTTLGLHQSDLKEMVTIMREVSEVKAVWIHGVILDRLLNVLSSEGET